MGRGRGHGHLRDRYRVLRGAGRGRHARRAPAGRIPGLPESGEGSRCLRCRNRDWISAHSPMLGLVHGDPANPLMEALVKQLAERTRAGFLVGGLASARGSAYTIANGVTQGGLSGVLFGEEVPAHHPAEPGLLAHRSPPHHYRGAAQHPDHARRAARPRGAQGGHRRDPLA